MLFLERFFIALLTLVISHTAWAATVTGSLPVTATVITNCLIGTVSPVAFGNYDPTSATANTAGVGNIPVICTLGDVYNIGLNAGTFTGATVTTRRMTGTTAAGLQYSLFRDSGRTLNWGNTVGTDTLQDTATGVSQPHSVFGQIPALQAVAAGSYADTVTITVTF